MKEIKGAFCYVIGKTYLKIGKMFGKFGFYKLAIRFNFYGIIWHVRRLHNNGWTDEEIMKVIAE